MNISDDDVKQVISEVAGEDVVPLVKILKNRKNVSEFELADKLKKEINVVRNMLYRLYNANLVSFIRKKDKEKGWYIHYWTFNYIQVNFLRNNLKEKRIERLGERLEREKSSKFFSCPNGCLRFDFEQAVEHNFKCVECGALLNQEDNSKKIESIFNEIEGLKKEISGVKSSPKSKRRESVVSKKPKKQSKKKRK